MARKSGSFGILILLVVMGVVLVLVARAWNRLAPAAIAVGKVEKSSPLRDHGQVEAGEALRSGRLPNLGTARQETASHTQQVQEGLAAVE